MSHPREQGQLSRSELEPGLRERGKIERQRRLKEAAKTIFSRRGYDAATTREIAREAGVSIGTLFVYAKDKRDLLFLVFNDELDPIADLARKRLPQKGCALDRICALTRPWYDYFSANAELGRYAFREMTFYEPHSRDFGEQCARYRRRMQRIESLMCEIIADARDRGELAFAEPTALVGNLVYVVYLAEIRRWIHEHDPAAIRGVKNLRAKLAIIIHGLQSSGPGIRRQAKPAINRAAE
jgi:AcrR family transcriptional regulator